MTQFSRRRFIASTGVATVGAIGSMAASPSGYWVAQAQAPETTKVRLGYLPIVESAPLIIAKVKGYFEKHGIKDAEVIKQASWSAARDNVEIGSAGGGIDGGQWQLPMPHMLSEGKITKGNQKIKMYNLLQLNTQGNGIAVANKHKDKGIGLDASKAKAYFDQLKASGNIFKAAMTFPMANQEFWIRYWLASGGINPDTDVQLVVLPPAQTVANMRTGATDAFSTGDPWPYRIVNDDIGFMPCLTAEIWKDHPEEYLAIRADWVDKNPKATKAILKAVIEAQQWCDVATNRNELAQILSDREFYNVPEDVLQLPFQGKIDMGTGRTLGAVQGVWYFKTPGGAYLSYPYKSHEMWFLTESIRWGVLPGGTDIKKIVDAVNREDLWKEAAKELGVPAAAIPKSTSRGVETFFDGTKFDPANHEAYLKSLKIKKV